MVWCTDTRMGYSNASRERDNVARSGVGNEGLGGCDAYFPKYSIPMTEDRFNLVPFLVVFFFFLWRGLRVFVGLGIVRLQLWLESRHVGTPSYGTFSENVCADRIGNN